MTKLKGEPHREWFMPIKKKRCPCGRGREPVMAWGQYVHARWRTIQHFCEKCFGDVLARMKAHVTACGCSFEFQARSGYELPAWLREKQQQVAQEIQ
jgi:hypothetical protein